MRIRCPVCSTAIKATEEHVGLKNRCIECQTKFIVPASEDSEIEILERGEEPGPRRLRTDQPAPKKLISPATKPTSPSEKLKLGSSAQAPMQRPEQVERPDHIVTPEEAAAARRERKELVTGEAPTKRRVVRKKLVKRKVARKRPAKPLAHEESASTTPEPAPTEILEPKAHEPTTEPIAQEEEAPEKPEPDIQAPEIQDDRITHTLTPAPSNRYRDTIEKRTEEIEERARRGEALEKAEQEEPPEPKEVAPVVEEPAPTEPLTETDRPKTPSETKKENALPAATGRGSFLDLRVNRQQSQTRGVGAIVILGVLVIAGFALFAALSGKSDSEEDATAEAPTAPVEKLPEESPIVKPLPELENETPEENLVVNEWTDVIHPMLEHYCLDCHDEANEEGGVEMERFETEKMAIMEPKLWEKAAALVKMGDMPPRDRFDQPSEEDRQKFIAWVTKVGQRWDSGEMGTDPGRTTIRRLTKNEYNYTMRDLFGLKIRPADNFPEDGGGEEGFDNNADALYLPALLMENYVESAGLIVNAIYQNQQIYTRYLFAFPHKDGGIEGAARKVMEHWMPRVYRRPVEKEEVDKMIALVKMQMEKKKKDYRTAMKMPLLALLISPHFLYRSEKIRPDPKPYRVSDLELASRLSYFLWSSTPDMELLKLAQEGKLSDPEIYEKQVRRMLVDERSKSLGMHFGGQWLKWEDLRSRANPDKRRFYRFDFELRVAMYRESFLFFDHLVKKDRPIYELIDSEYSFLNPRLAVHYDIPGVTKQGFQKILLDDPNRGGVLGMGSVLTATSLPLRSSPSVRGNYVLTELMGTPPPSPPMNVPQLPEDDRELEFTSFRDALTQHRLDPSCKGCHETIDPLGFGLENFDAIGRWRQYQNDTPVDSSGVLPDGTRFNSPEQLKKILLKRKGQFARNMTTKALSYGLGRDLTPYDRPTISAITEKVIAAGYSTQTLFLEVAKSYLFLHCRGDKPGEN